MSMQSHVDEIDRALQGLAVERDGYITRSWQRCVTEYGMDPTRPSPAYIVPDSQLKLHRQQSEKLISIARTGLEELFRTVASQNYVLLLTDPKGVTVDYFGDPKFEDQLRKAGLYLGADWSETLAGTCGVGACIATGDAVTVHQNDHFDPTHTVLSCTAAPIFDLQGSLTAVLDISLLRSPMPKISQRLAMHLVKASARRIELANLMAEMSGEWVLRFSHVPEFLDVDPEAAIAVDGSGCILAMTNGAARLLRTISPDRPVIGRNISAYFELGIDDLPSLTRARHPEERVIRLLDGAALFGHAIAPQRMARGVEEAEKLPDPIRALGGNDSRFKALQAKAARLARARMPVLITGACGTGKDRLARAMHRAGSRTAPFVTLICADIPEDRFEEALFGNGAAPAGLLEAARGGTLYLDEVGEMPLQVQSRLARALDDDAGAEASSRSIRVIASSTHDLAEKVRGGGFRSDLLFRLTATSLSLPALKDRADLGWLIDRLLRVRTVTMPDSYRLSDAARRALLSRDWPGNIRELINTLDVAVALCEGGRIELEDLPRPVLPSGDGAADPAPALQTQDEATALAVCGWNISRAARHLGIDRSTLHRRIRRQGLKRPETPDATGV